MKLWVPKNGEFHQKVTEYHHQKQDCYTEFTSIPDLMWISSQDLAIFSKTAQRTLTKLDQ